MKPVSSFFLFSLLFSVLLKAAAPVPYTGKISVRGVNYFGEAQFRFSLHDGQGTTYWQNGEEVDDTLKVSIHNGRYHVLLGGQGMNPLPPELFLEHEELYLRVEFKFEDGDVLQHLAPDQVITATPRALVAEWAKMAKISERVSPGAITRSMLSEDVLADLNKTGVPVEPGSPPPSAESSISLDMLASDVKAELNATIGQSRLAADVLAALNKTITREMLSPDVRADLNRTITKSMLAEDIKNDLNRTITLGDLAPEVIADLNDSIQLGSITLDLLSSQVRNDINRTITKSMLSQEVLNELNSSSGGGGVVPGSLLAVPRNQSAPSGYSLYEGGEPKDLVWEEKAPVSVARYAGDGVEVLGGKIYFVGGWTDSSSSAQNIAERYDPATNTWETLANMSAARRGVACAALNGKLYAIGGAGSSVEVFDPSTDSWSTSVALPSGVKWGTATTINGKIFLMGGRNDSGAIINQVLCFDPSTNQWSAKANMPTSREAMKLIWFENRIWAIGGNYGSGNEKNIVESYDPTTDTWQAEASLTIARDWPVAWVANDRVFVGGGYDGSSRVNSIEVYDPATKQWTSAGNFPENKFAADAVVLNDKVYVVAGQTAAGVFSNKVFAADLNASVSGVFDLYRKDGNASSGVPTVQAEVADGSITTDQLSEQILKYLQPEVTTQPSFSTIRDGGVGSISASIEGKYLSYQWKKNGVVLDGETNPDLFISDANASLHDGNYSLVVSNDFGVIETNIAELSVMEAIPRVTWDKTVGSSLDDHLSSILITSGGEILILGDSSSNASGDKTQNSKGDRDFWMVKLDANGSKIWDKTLGGSIWDHSPKIKSINDGKYIIAGPSRSEITGDKSEGSNGSQDYWVIKIDENGSKIWDKSIGGPSQDISTGLTITLDSKIIVAGHTNNFSGGDKTEEGKGMRDFWIVKLDTNGSKLWDKTIGGTGNDFAQSIATTNDGDYLIFGSSDSNATGDKSENSNGGNDFWVVKLDDNGSKIWDKTIGGTGDDVARSIVTTESNELIIAGSSSSDTSGDKSENTEGGNDFWVVKLDENGSKIWDKTIGGTGNDVAQSIAITNEGEYLISGTSDSNATGDKTEDSKGGNDYWVVKLDEDGFMIWDKTIGGTGSDSLKSTGFSPTGDLVIAGTSDSNTTGDKTENSKGLTDYWLVRLNTSGN